MQPEQSRPRPLNDLEPGELLELMPGATPGEVARLFAAAHRPGSDLLLAKGVRREHREAAAARPLARLEVVERRRASDGFVKYLFASPLGGQVEAVRIPLFEEKHVVCVSSQVGCALGCTFCHTGRMGFTRNLEAWEMVEQVRAVRDEADLPLRHLVFMGMGEPLLNYERVLRAARILCAPGGLQISKRSITLSTAGITPQIRRYTREGHPYRLTFSLTSAIAGKRLSVMPVERTHPLPELSEAIREHALERRERVMIAYVMISGFNTGREDALALAELFRGVPLKLDLIDVADPDGVLRPPGREELERFRDELQVLKAPIARRYSGGVEIGAACGTLAATRRGGSLVPPA